MNVIAHNLLAMNAQRQYGIVNNRQAKTTEKLSSGYRINRAADDAAGLSISEKMRRLIRGLNQAAENIEEGIGYVQTADGALDEVQAILQRVNELAVKSANGTNTQEDRGYIDSEVQQLKDELDRIFTTTSYNERKIWEVTGDKKLLAVVPKQAVTSTTGSKSIKVTNESYGIIATNGYRINADDQGIHISWTGHNGTSYQTEKVDWDTLEANQYSFEMSDYYDKQAYPELFGANDEPLIKQKVSFRIEETATRDDIIACLNGTSMSGSASVSLAGRFEATDGNENPGEVSIHSVYMNYRSAYATRGAGNNTDGRDFDAADDAFFEPTGGSGNANLIQFPSATTVDDARSSTDKWTFSFELNGIGRVTATSKSVDYASNDNADDDENLWWKYIRVNHGNGNYEMVPYTISRSLSGGTLGDVMSALTGDRDSNTPGLLTDRNGGCADTGGYININFDLIADNSYSYGTSSDTSVGSFYLKVRVDASDTEESILNKINNSLNANTILDFYTTSGSNDSASIGSFSAKSHTVDVPIWGGACEFWVHAGPEADQRLDIVYDSLSLLELGMQDTNVLTTENSNKTIQEVRAALMEVNKQRSDFGAYQNRLEHAYRNTKNTEENTQAAESLIRDTDMAKTMVEYANQNILMQAGQAMMAQANQSNQGVLSLLNK